MSTIKTGDPRLLAEAVARDPLNPDIEAFLASLDLTAEERAEVKKSLPVLTKAITQAKDAPSITVYGGNWV